MPEYCNICEEYVDSSCTDPECPLQDVLDPAELEDPEPLDFHEVDRRIDDEWLPNTSEEYE